MKKLLLVLLAVLLIVPATAETIDLSGMSLSQLEELAAIVNQEISNRRALLEQESVQLGYENLPLADALAAIGKDADTFSCTYSHFETSSKAITVHVNVDRFVSYKRTLQSSIEFTLLFCKQAFVREDVHTLRFYFHVPAHDKYGNTVDTQPIMYKISAETFAKMNYDYFYEYRNSQPGLFLDAIDLHAVRVEYKQDLY